MWARRLRKLLENIDVGRNKIISSIILIAVFSMGVAAMLVIFTGIAQGYTAVTNACITCHNDTGYPNDTDGNGVAAPYKRPHNDTVMCESCHGTNPHNMTFIQPGGSYGVRSTAASCPDCHEAGIANFTSAPMIPNPLHHSTNISNGSVWGSYWTDTVEVVGGVTRTFTAQRNACMYCHNNTLHNTTPVGRILEWSSNKIYAACLDCHYKGSVNYTSMSSTFASAGLQIPPEITNGTNWNGHTNYYNHSFGVFDDQKCRTCHGSLLSGSSMSEFVHKVSEAKAGDDCLGCHSLRMGDFPEINSTSFGKHINVNITDGIDNLTNSDCKTCHYDTTVMSNVQTYACVDCHTKGNFSAPIISNHRPGGVNISTTAYCSACHNNSINQFAYSVNASVSHYGTNASLIDTKNCTTCHKDNTNGTIWGGAPDPASSQTFPHTIANTPKEDCYTCHNNVSTSDFHNITLIKPDISTVTCLDCHRTERTVAPKEIDAGVFATGAHRKRVCENCHGGALDTNMNNYSLSSDPAKTCTYCHISGNFSAPLIVEHNQVGQDIITQAANCISCHENNGMYLPNAGTNGTTSAVTHYLKEVTNISNTPYLHFGPINTSNCIDCHNGPNTSNPNWGSPVNISTSSKRQHSENQTIQCDLCHNDGNVSSLEIVDFHNASVKLADMNDCLKCHTKQMDAYPAINITSFGGHSNINTTDGIGSLTNSDCKTCHYDTTNMSNVLTYACIDCHVQGNYSAPIISNHRPPSLPVSPGASITTGAYCTACHNNSINMYNYSANASVSHYGTINSLIKPTVNQTAMPRFGFMVPGEAAAYNRECNNCHNPSNSSYGNATLITVAHTANGTCSECHVNVNASDLHNSSLGIPQTFGCKDCHTTNASKYRAPNITGTDMVNYPSCDSTSCHGGTGDNGNHQFDTLVKHKVNRNFPGTPGRTDTVYLNGQTAISVTRGSAVTVTSRVNDSLIGAASRVGGAEYYIDVDPGVGKGVPLDAADGQYDAVRGNWENITGTIDTGSLSEGTHSVYVRGMDIGKQWSAAKSATLTVRSLGYINGTIMDSVTKVGIAGAIVTTNTSVTTTANESGFYSLQIMPGTYILTATSEPRFYPNNSVMVTVVAGATVVQDIELLKRPTGIISGVVTNA